MLKNNDKPEIKQMLKNLNAIITISATVGEEFQNGQRIALLVDKLDNEDKSISFKEMKSALRNNANNKKGKVVFKDDFIPLKQILFKDMHFKNFSELLIFMDSDKDGVVSVPEFANMYIRAKLTQALERDINENFIDETYTEMLKLFGIGDETATVDNDEEGEEEKTSVPRNRQQKEEEDRQEKLKEEQAKQKEEEDDQKFIVKLTADGTFSVTQNTAYRDYKKKLDDIPKTACKPETTTNN